MSQLEEIYEGWKNLIFENPEIEKIAKKRIAICVACNKFNKLHGCNECGCYMPAKVRCPKSKCDLNKW